MQQDLSEEEKKEKKRQYMRDYFQKRNGAKKNDAEAEEKDFYKIPAIKEIVKEYGQSNISRIKLASDVGETAESISDKVGLAVEFIEDIIKVIEENK